jgi:hypothetical protein
VLITSNQSISDQILSISIFSALLKINKHLKKLILFFSAINFVKKSCKIKSKLSKLNAQQNSLQNTQQNKQEIQMRIISESDFTQIITKNLQKLDIFEKSSVNLSSQSSINVI